MNKMELNDVGRLLMSMTKKVKKTASQIVHPLTQLEKWLKEATSNTNWGCSSTILNEIARSMTDYHDYILVQKCIGDCLSEKATKWRRIFKTLVLVEYLLKNGVDRFVDDFKECAYKVRNLQDFYYTEEGKDKGAGIREKSKYILNLMNDPVLLKTERKKAKDNRGKYIGINGKSGIVGTGGGGFIGRSNSSAASTKFNNNNSSSVTISSYSVTTNGTNTSRMGSLYDPYCYSSNSKDEDYSSSSQAEHNVSDGLDVVKNAGVVGEMGRVRGDVITAKLPGPPSYSSTSKGRGGGGGGIRRVEAAKEGPGFHGNGMAWISDESILNAAQKLAMGNVVDAREDKEDLEWSDWSSFVAAEATRNTKKGGMEENALSQPGGAVSNQNKGKDALSLNPFDSDCLKAKAQMEIERRKKIMDESIIGGNLLDLDYSCNKNGRGTGLGFNFNKGTENKEHDYYNDGFQQKNGTTVGSGGNIHVPYGF